MFKNIAALLASLVILFSTVYYIYRVKKGDVIFVRKMAALDAIQEAIGRCAEMGRPVHLSAGGHAKVSRAGESPQVIAGNSIVAYSAEVAVQKDVKMIATVSNADNYPITYGLVREAYLKEGKLMEFDPDYSVRYYSEDPAYAHRMGVIGVLYGENPGANIQVGAIGSDSYFFPEISRKIGAINIVGTARALQVPIIAIAADYCLIGDEVFAAGAYVSNEPLDRASIAGNDLAKYVILGFIIIGSILQFLGIDVILRVLEV